MPTGRAALLALALAAAGATAAARLALAPEAAAARTLRNPAWLPDGRMLRAAAMGQRLLLADYYWLQTVSYMGETLMAGSKRWEALYPLADLVTDLDPRYGYAYQVAGSNLAGLAGRHDEAERILKKGMENVPDRWSLPFVHATNKFLYQEAWAEAAEYARRAAAVGKRPHLALLAANLSAMADTEDEYQVSIDFLDQMLEQAEQPELKEQLRTRRLRLETFRELSRLERAVAAHRAATGALPRRAQDLVPGQLPALPRHPGEGRFTYDPATGAVASTVFGTREKTAGEKQAAKHPPPATSATPAAPPPPRKER
jgi:hypothetical protein